MTLVGTKIASQVGTAEFIVKRGTADWPVDHDFERRGHAVGMREVIFPGLCETRNAKVRNRET